MTAAENFQRRAVAEGRQVQEIAAKVLQGSGFTDLKPNQQLKDLGVTVNFIATDQGGKIWYFDVSGAFTSQRAGLIRTDTMWKALGRANVLHQSGIERLVLLTTNLPKPGSVGHRALTAAADTFFDAIEMLTPEGKARLVLYAEASFYHPLPGLRPAQQLYSGLTTTAVGTDIEVRVPLAEVSAALPARASADVQVMPYRLKVFLPSKSESGTVLSRDVREKAGERIRGLLSDFCGGCTLVPGIGSWLDPIGGEMFEDVILVEAYADLSFPADVISEVVRTLITDLNQHTAALIVNDAMVHITPR